MWNEGRARRIGDDIGSCLYRYITRYISSEVQHLTMYSDTCEGQNKNTNMTIMCMKALRDSATLETIAHKFLVLGHTHMESDTDHSHIEKNKNKFKGVIEHPHDWVQLVRQVGKEKPFIVKDMNRTDFYAFSSLFKGALVNRKLDKDGNVNWRNVQWLRYEKECPGVLKCKTSLKESSDFQSVSFKRRGKFNMSQNIPLSYDGPVAIATLKKKDLLDLLPFIPESLWNFYKNLKSEDDMIDEYPDDEAIDEE